MTAKLHIGTKLINAAPMNRQQYNDLRGWEVPSDENPADDGYLVEYIDGGSANHPDYAGYISWSPKDVFERAYRSTDRMTFGDALVMLKAGKLVCRTGWNGKGMWISVVTSWNGAFAPLPPDHQLGKFLVIKSADNNVLPWNPSQADMFAEDWMVFSESLDITGFNFTQDTGV